MSLYKLLSLFFFALLFWISCKTKIHSEREFTNNISDTLVDVYNSDSLFHIEQIRLLDSILSQNDSSWADLTLLLPNAKFDIRYSDTNNFMNLKVYDCPACFIRLAVAKALMNASKELDSLDLGFVFFDCFRPTWAQWKLWDKMPDPRYVHPPTLGSRHSRGVAVDLSLFDKKTGKLLDMGTEFDYFGKEAWWSYTGHNIPVVKNRKILYKIMVSNGFTTVANEWWHFDFKNRNFNLSSMKWNCN